MVQAQLKKQPRQEKESPDMSDKVIKALKAKLSIPKSPSAEHMFVYKGWNAGGATRARYQYMEDQKIISYFLHIYKDMVKVWLPKNNTDQHDILLDL